MTMGGQVVDASIVRVLTQRNRRGENEAIEAGEVPGDWKARPTSGRKRMWMPAGPRRTPRATMATRTI
jgi:hypothetical protein